MTNSFEPRAAARSVRVIGIGNPDRGDDGIGAVVVHRLIHRLPDDVSVLMRSGDMLTLSNDMAGIDALVFIDAAAPAGSPGRIHRIDLTAGRLERSVSFASSHSFGLADAIALAQALGIASQAIVVYAIEGACFELGASITLEVVAAAGLAADRVVAEVSRLRCGNQKGLLGA